MYCIEETLLWKNNCYRRNSAFKILYTPFIRDITRPSEIATYVTVIKLKIELKFNTLFC